MPTKTAEQEAVNGTGPERTAPANVIEAIARVMSELPGIGRDSKSPQGYNFRGIEAITAQAQKLCGKYCVVFAPRVTSRKTIDLTIGGKPWTEEQLEVEYDVYGPGGTGDKIVVGPLVGLGRDNSDKGSNKALTQAYKYALIQVFQIGDAKADADSDTAHEADARTHQQTRSAPEDTDATFVSLGWLNHAAELAWRESYKERFKKFTDPKVKADARIDAQNLGLVHSEPIPKAIADAVDQLLREYLTPPTTSPEADGKPETAPQAVTVSDTGERICNGCDQAIGPSGGCGCPF